MDAQDELIDPDDRVDRARVERRVADWKKRLDQLYRDILSWLPGLCRGHVESEVDSRCRAAIKRAQQQPDWQSRRGWDLYNPDDRRLSGPSFEDRTAFLLHRAGGRGSPYARTMLRYATRNRLAHGRLQSTRVDVVAIPRDFYSIQAALA